MDDLEQLKYDADNGNKTAQYKMGKYYYEKKDFDQAIEYLNKHGLPKEALLLLGQIYYEKNQKLKAKGYFKDAEMNGISGAREELEKIHLEQLKINADKGNKRAQYEYGKMLYENEDIDSAIKYLKKSASQGQGHIKANDLLGTIYCNEQYEKTKNIEDIEKGIYWLEKSEHPGNSAAKIKLDAAKNKLKKEKIKLLEKKSEDGNKEAQHELALDYKDEGNNERYKYWLEKAAGNKHPKAQYEVGLNYYNANYGFDKNDVKALENIIKAAKQGVLDAQCKLGEIYYYDKDDYQRGIEWLQRASSNGSTKAADLLSKIRDAQGTSSIPLPKWTKGKSIGIISLFSIGAGYLIWGDFAHLGIFAAIFIVLIYFTHKFFDDFYMEDNQWANLILGLGTFGTFVGILTTMMNLGSFNEDEIAIGQMLVGLKFVFVTSVLGLGTSIGLRWLRGKYYKGIEEDKQSNALLASLDKISADVRSISTDWKKSTEEAIEHLFSSLVSNISVKIDEVLGDNFKTFREAMDNVVRYQKDNKVVLENTAAIFSDISSQQKQIFNNIEKIGTFISDQNRNQKEQKDILDAVKENFAYLDSQINNLSNSIAAQKEFADVLKNVLSETTIKVNEFKSQISDLLNGSLNQTQQIKDSIKEQIEDIIRTSSDQLKSMMGNIENQNQTIKDVLKTQVEDLLRVSNEQITPVMESFEKQISQIMDGNSRQSQEFIENIAKNTTEINEAVNKQTQELKTLLFTAFNMGTKENK